MNKGLLLAAVLGLILLIVIVGQNLLGGSLPFLKSSDGTAKINDKTFQIELAKSEEEKKIGLSKKNSLREDQGMLFTFDSAGFYPFWMKEMKFPIDIIYIRDNKIITIFHNVPAPESKTASLPTYSSDQPADKVLEVKGGVSDKYSIKEGDTVTFTL